MSSLSDVPSPPGYAVLLRAQYMNHFPTELPRKVAQSFLATAAVQCFFGLTYKVCLLAGIIAATATLIESFTRPIIQIVFPNHLFLGRCIQLTLSKAVTMGLGFASPLIREAYKMQASVLSFFVWFALNQGSYEKNIALAEVL